MLLGFGVAAVGAFLFYPAAAQRVYGLFLGALFVLASGITLLQVAANPYVAILRPPALASARLTLTQAFNSLVTTIAPLLDTALILSHLPKLTNAAAAAQIDVRAVQIPYLLIGGTLLLISLLLSQVHLPVIAQPVEEFSTDTLGNQSIWRYRHLVFGVLGIFAYVGAEVAVGSHIVSYVALPNVLGLDPAAAGNKVAYYWGAAMVGRFAGAYLLNKFSPTKLLAFNAFAAVALILISIATSAPIVKPAVPSVAWFTLTSATTGALPIVA